MDANLIVMLTHHDRTIPDALEVFHTASDLPVDCWGFKDVGLPEEQMVELAAALQHANKKVFLEVVSYSEPECMKGARLAVALKCDYLMGTLFYPRVWDYLKDTDLTYLPFLGKVSGSPSILAGTDREMIDEALRYMALGVEGFDILAFRHDTHPEMIARSCVRDIPGIVVIAGSVASKERIGFIESIGAWGFTMGSALFDNAFVDDGGFRANLDAVTMAMGEIS
jgi:hypothetical protein